MKDAERLLVRRLLRRASPSCPINSVVKAAPKDWTDLLSPTLKQGGPGRRPAPGRRGLRRPSSPPRSANGGSLDNIQPGIDFFAKLKKAGNFNPTSALPANIAKGATPVAIRWDYLLLATRDTFAGNPAVTVNVPKSGTYAGVLLPGDQQVSPRTPTPPSCGRSTCTATRGSCSSSRATRTRPATRTWPRAARYPGGAGGQAAPGRGLQEARSSPPWPRSPRPAGLARGAVGPQGRSAANSPT